MVSEQMMLEMPLPVAVFTPTAAQLRVGDVLEGYSGRAFPRPLTVVGIQDDPDEGAIQVVYREQVAGDERYGAFSLPLVADISLQPPF
jgi:hypothetical protein